MEQKLDFDFYVVIEVFQAALLSGNFLVIIAMQLSEFPFNDQK